MMTYDGIIIGGGPAGMFAAITAAERGQRVLLLERNDRLGKKLLITGKGRCNVTNHCSAQEIMQNVPRNGRFLFSAVNAFPPERILAFFEENGCPLKQNGETGYSRCLTAVRACWRPCSGPCATMVWMSVLPVLSGF